MPLDLTSLISLLKEQIRADVSRSDALKPLLYPLGFITVLILAAIAGRAPQWIVGVLIVALLVAVAFYFGAYRHFMLNNPDALRSERFILQKMAIEQKLIGDSSTGLFNPDEEAGEVAQHDTPARQIAHDPSSGDEP
jgi:hypothetical protein